VSILEFRNKGYLPETMFNFIGLIGWSLDDKTELMTRQEMIDYFSLERIGKTGAVFNREKLEWMNGVYIRNLSPEDFFHVSLPFLEKGLPAAVKRPLDIDYVRQVMPLVQERTRTLVELPDLVEFFFIDKLEYEPEMLVGKKMTPELTIVALEEAFKRLQDIPSFQEEPLENLLRPLAVELELKTGQLFGALRNAVTGRTATPPLFQTMAVLGRDCCLERIRIAIDKLHTLIV
jgi:glutamyl-tRNA synthetase